MLELHRRIEKLSHEEALFLSAVITDSTVFPQPLATVMLRMLGERHSLDIGPMHRALSSICRERSDTTQAARTRRDQSLLMIHACGGDAAALQVLKFIMDLGQIRVLGRRSLTGPGYLEPGNSVLDGNLRYP